MAIPAGITQLIAAHSHDQKRTGHNGSLPQLSVSKTASAMAKIYEVIRNTLEYEEDHLLRKRAIKRILMRMAILKRDTTPELARDVVRELIWANYVAGYPIPETLPKLVEASLAKYRRLVVTYIHTYGHRPDRDIARFIYALMAVEVERILVPHSAQDMLAAAEYSFLLPMKLFGDIGLGEKDIPVQTYISTHRALLKSDDDIIGYYLFHNAMPHWGNPPEDYYPHVARNLEKVVGDIKRQLNVRINPKLTNEVVRQSIPFKIIDKIIAESPGGAESVLTDSGSLEDKIEEVANSEYKRIKGKLNGTIIKSIIYLFITKVIFALLVEVPYEHVVIGHINYFAIAVNVIFPPIMLFIIASTFSIPTKSNTAKLKEMINSILDPSGVDMSAFKKNYAEIDSLILKVAFKMLNTISFFAVFGLIILVLYLAGFTIVGIGVFLMFLTIILFVALRLRKTATEIVVVPRSRSVFSPILDLVSVPLLRIGRGLSDTVAQLNIFIIFFDVLIEAPFKSVIKLIDEWTAYLRDRRDEIV